MGTLSPDHLKFLKKKQIELLKEKQRRKGITPLDHIREHDKQLMLTLSPHINRWFFGGNRTGKTAWGAHECARFLHKRHPVIPFDEKPVEGWACCPSFDVQEETTQPQILSLLDPSRIVSQNKLRGDILLKLRYRADDNTISTLNFKSYEQGRSKFQGAGKNFIWFDEEAPKDVYDEATIRSKAGYPLYTFNTMTPVNGMTWVYDDVYMRTNDPNLKIVTAEWNDNIFLTEEQKAQMRGRYTSEALQMREKGLFVRRTGLVCSWWRRDKHLVDDIFSMIPKGSDVYAGIDFGFSAPAAVVYVAIDYDNNFYIFDGIYETGLTTPRLKELMFRKEQAFASMGLNVRQRFADSAQAADIAEMNAENVVTGERSMPVTPVTKEVGTSQENWDEFRARIMDEYGRVSQFTGKPKIYASSQLTRLNEKGEEVNWWMKEVENLKWDDVKRDGVLMQKARWKDTNAKHAVDAFSYLVKMIIAPEDPRAEQRRRAKEHVFQDEFEQTGWAAYMANPFGILIPRYA